MSFRAGMFLDAQAATSHAELVALGHVPDTESPHVLGYLDPIEDPAARPADEGPQGVEVRQHPHATLRDDPEIWDIVDRFRSGVTKDLSHAEFESMSNWQLEAWLIMRASHQREEQREIKRMRNKGGADG